MLNGCWLNVVLSLQKVEQSGAMDLMKVSVSKVIRNGNKRFCVSWRPPGQKRIKRYFKTKADADAEVERVELQKKQTGEVWLSITAAERNEIVSLYFDAQKRGVNLRDALTAFKPSTTVQKRVEVAFNEFMVSQHRAFVSNRTMAALKSNIGRFVQTCAQKNLSDLTEADVMAWLDRFHPKTNPNFTPATFNSYLTSLNTFFRWCQRLKYLSESPATSIAKIDRNRVESEDKPVKTLTFDELKALLTATMEHDPGLIRYVAVCCFAGLRPEREAAKLNPADIGNHIHVRGRTAKDRQERFVEITPTLAKWLAMPLIDPLHGPACGDYPIKNLRNRFEVVRAAAGLIKLEPVMRLKKRGKGDTLVFNKIIETKWQQDIMRHTFASIHLALFGAERTKESLGHGDYDMLFNHYRKAMSREAAERFFTLTPEFIVSRV